MSATLTKSSYFFRTYVNIIKVLTMGKHSFCLDNRPSNALSKYPNFPALLRGEKRSFFFYICHLYKIFLFFENICEYYQGISYARSTVFLITDFLMPFQNTLNSRLSSAEKSDHFPFISATYTKSSYFWRTYVNIFKVLAMR